MSKLTWADVKMWQLFIEQDVRAVKVGKDTALWEDGSCSELFGEEVIDRVVCQFDLSWFNIDNGGFTIPDEVMEGEQGKPAVEFEAGEWFEDEDGDKHLRCEGGSIQISSGWPAVYSDDNLSLPRRGFGNCHPCEPDFFIFTEGELRDVKEQAYLRGLQDRKELREADGIDEGEDSAKPSRKQELLDHLKRSTEIVSTWPEWAKGMLGNSVEPERVNVGHNDTPEDDAVGEDAVQDLIDYCRGYFPIDSHQRGYVDKASFQYERMKEEADALDVAYVVGRDHGRNEKPTIPQEVREFFKTLKYWEALKRVQEGSPLWNNYQAALQSIDRREVAKPHPLTKVREFITYGCNLYGSEKACELNWKAQAARRELQEYDGVVDSGHAGSDGGGK